MTGRPSVAFAHDGSTHVNLPFAYLYATRLRSMSE